MIFQFQWINDKEKIVYKKKLQLYLYLNKTHLFFQCFLETLFFASFILEPHFEEVRAETSHLRQLVEQHGVGSWVRPEYSMIEEWGDTRYNNTDM